MCKWLDGRSSVCGDLVVRRDDVVPWFLCGDVGMGVWLSFYEMCGMHTHDKIFFTKGVLRTNRLDIVEWIGAYYPSNY